MTSDHYQLLGVEPTASKDEIKAAYRAEIANADSAQRAELNRAWNVLSDPMQRQRYDAARMVGEDVDDADEFAEQAPAVPTRRLTGARRGPETTEVVAGGKDGGSSNGNGSGSSGRGGSSGDDDGRRRPPPPTIELPDDLVMAEPKPRSLAMLFDFSVLLVIFLIVQFIGVALIENRYPKQTDRVDALSKQVDKAETAKDKANNVKSKADDNLKAAKKDNDSAAEADAKDAADRADAKAAAAEKKAKSLNNDLLDAQNELRPMYLLITGAVLVLALLYTVPMSARTGQTLGKKLRKLKLVRVDGSPPGWSGSLIHYGIPIVITLAFSGFLGPIALVLGLGCVLWNIRDRNRQGVHDKLAKTFVVEA
jgi:curved DNA-binding protein CbpA